MPNSLKVRIKKLEHDGKITSEECAALLNKLEGHDAKVKADAIDEFVKSIEKNQTMQDNYFDAPRFEMSVDMTDILKIAEQLKENKE